MKPSRSLPLSALAIVLAPASLLAADAEPLEMPPLVITRAAPIQQSTPASLKVIDRQKIEDSGASSLTEVLQGQAGLQVRDMIGDGSRIGISLRGFGENAANNTLVLVDGRRLNNPTQQGPDLASVPLANIERIEILRGAGTVLYGDQAVGGVINIVTRRPTGNQAYLETSQGSHDLEAYRGHLYQDLGGGLSGYLSGETRNADNYRDHNHGNYDNAFARLRHDRDSGHLLYEYQSVDDELELPGYLTEAQRRADRKASYLAGGNGWSDSKTHMQRLAAQQQLTDWLTADFDYSDRDSDGVGAYGATPLTQGTRVESMSPRLSGHFQSALGRSDWLLGYDHIASDAQTSFGTDFLQTQRDWYGQLTQPFSEALSLTLGYRSSEAEDRNRAQSSHHTDREDSSSVGLSWQIEPRLRAILKREDVLRWANVDDNAFISPDQAFLKPQTGESWESGVEWADDVQRYQATLYRLDLQDEIMYDPLAYGPGSPFGFPGANINLDETRRDGLLLEAERQLSERLSIGGQYSYTDSEFRAGNFQGNEVPGVSRHNASAHLSYQILPGLKGYLESVYTGARYLSSDNAHALPREGGYTLFNAALSYDYQQFTTRLRLNNLTGKRYESFASYADYVPGGKSLYPAAEENVQLSLGYRF